MLGVDRQAEVHEGADPLRRRERRRGRRRPRGPGRALALRAAPPDAARAARARRLLAAADPVDRRRGRAALHRARDGARRVQRLVLDRPRRLPGAAAGRRRASSSCSACRASSSRSSASTSAASSVRSRAGRSTRSTASFELAFPAMAKRVLVTGGAGFISSNFIRHLLRRRRTRSSRSTRSPTRATSRTSPT